MNKQAKPSLRAKNAVERGMNLVFLLCGFIAIAFVVLITIYLIISGLPAIKEVGLIDFLFGTRWASTDKTNPAYGILPFILTSIYGTAGAIIIGVPIGFLTAVFLAKVAPPKVAAVIRPAVDLLAGIPSVVYGLVGMMVLLPAIREFFNIPAGDSLLAAIIVLAVMILPSIISVSETALKAVPKEYEEASLALAILMVAGNVANMPSMLSSVKFLTTAIASEMSYAAVGSLQRNALYSIGLVLFLFIMLINVVLDVFLKRDKEA